MAPQVAPPLTSQGIAGLPKLRPEIAAAIDLGSNSFHMIVARIQDEQLAVIDRIRESVRLADGLDKNGDINEATFDSALKCLERFGQRLADFPAGSVRAVGTSTLRNANNSDEFLALAEKALGHPLDIIAGVEEARLIYLGVAQSLAVSEQRRLIMDIGGSSTELIVGQGYTPEYMESMEMGCVTITKKFFSDGKVTAKQVENARIFARTELEPHVSTFQELGWQQSIGASGTIRAVQKVAVANGWCDSGISKTVLTNIIDVFCKTVEIEQVQLPGLVDERRPVFIGGTTILLAVFEALGIEHLEVSDRALREGLLHDLLDRFQDHDTRDTSVTALARRYHADDEQSQRVRQSCLQILPQVCESWGLNLDESAKWLSWAAQLHEIGLDIAHNRHHHHAAYIIEHSDLAGFSQQEQKFLAMMIRGHRRKLPSKLYKELPKRACKQVKRLSVILRLAVILHRSRSQKTLDYLMLKVDEKHIHLTFPEQWLTQHPLTEADLQQEIEHLKTVGFELSLS